MKRIYNTAKKEAENIAKEFRKTLLKVITTTFAFIMALSWREPISDTINWVIEQFPEGGGLLFKYWSAILITIMGVFVIVLLSRWKVKKESSE